MKTIFKKLSSVALAATLVFSANNSTAQAFEEGTSSASIGYGFGNIGNNLNSRFKNTVLATYTYKIQDGYQFSYLGPLFLKYEYAISDKFGLGLNVSYLTSTAEFTSTDFYTNEVFNNSINRTGYNIMMRFNWHFGDHDMIDPYFGLAGGYRSNNWSSDLEDQGLPEINLSTVFHVGIEATFGTRFLFTDNVGAYVEIGLARAFFQFGVTGKF
jgi:opacity protein-like surface antigen